MSDTLNYAAFVRLVRPVLNEYVKTQLDEHNNDLRDVLTFYATQTSLRRLEQEDNRLLRAALLQTLWEDGRKQPVPLSVLHSRLSAYQNPGKKLGESEEEKRKRCTDNFQKLRRETNRELAEKGIDCHIDLLRSSASQNLLNENGMLLELAPHVVAQCRELQRLKKLRQDAGGLKAVSLVLCNASKEGLRVGRPLSVSVKSQLAGWLTLALHWTDQSERLIPGRDGGSVRISDRRQPYILPEEVCPTSEWTMEPPTGRHILVAVVSKTQQVVSLSHTAEVAESTSLWRGVSVKPISVWDLPPKDFAVGYLAFSVLPERD